VHFDLKPSNVFLHGDTARVGDYGLSKMMTDGRSTLSFGRGTPHYMAPEILKSRADHRADVYSLGVVLYECLTGRLPYEPPVPGALHLREVDAPPPFPPEFPARWRPVVARCLRLAPEDRYGGVSELLAALGAGEASAAPAAWGSFAQVAPPGASASAAAASSRPTGAGAATPARSEARETAAELTRGAVEVARGVWDGLRAGARPPGGAPGASERAPDAGARGADAAAGDVAAGARRADADAPAAAPTPYVQRALAAVRGGSAADPREESDILVLHTLSDPGPARPGDGPARPDPGPAAGPPPLAPRDAASTIPVPPSARGGWFGTLAATARLALEVFLALARWLFALARRAVAGRARPERGAFARALLGTLRLAAVVVLLAVSGALTTVVAYVLVRERVQG
jgi:hypothetical protein